MLIKTSELTGAALDWAVEMARDPTLVWGQTIGRHWASNNIVIPALPEPECFRSASTNWAQGGPIIDHKRINLFNIDAATWKASPQQRKAQPYYIGETALIAAMRCYVASKLGDEVDIPKELCD